MRPTYYDRQGSAANPQSFADKKHIGFSVFDFSVFDA
jgi:hypothetical protein